MLKNKALSKSNRILQIVRNEEIAEHIYLLTLRGPLVSQMTQPGQFLHIKVGKGMDPMLRRPISICDVNLEEQTMQMIYRVEGAGTSLLSQTVAGDELDCLGPLGHGFPYQQRQAGEQVVLVGGGIGVPPLYYLSKQLVQQGVQVTHILGFQGAANVFFEQEFQALGDTYVTTVEGSYGTKGFVTDVLSRWPQEKWDAMYSCGPTPMLKALVTLFAGKEEAYISLEQRMGCGVGACLACVCPTPDSTFSYKKVCSDGPVFRVGEVIL